MQQLPTPSSRPGRRQKLLIGLLSGLSLDVILVAFLFLDSFFFQLAPIMWIICVLLLYLLAPLLPSLFIARQTGDDQEGQQTGLLTSLFAMVLSLLVSGIFLCALTLEHSGDYFISPFEIFFVLLLLTIAGFLVSVPGAIIGGKLGKAWQKRKFVS